MLRSAQSHDGQIWLQQKNGDSDITNAETLVKECFCENTNPLISRAVMNTLARIVRFTNGNENSGIVFAYVHNLLPTLVKQTASADVEVSFCFLSSTMYCHDRIKTFDSR